MFYFLGFKVGHFNEIYILKSVDDIYTVYAIIEMRKIERKKKDDGARESLPLSLMLFIAYLLFYFFNTLNYTFGLRLSLTAKIAKMTPNLIKKECLE